MTAPPRRIRLLRRRAQLHIPRRSLLQYADFRLAVIGQVTSQVADALGSLIFAQVLLFASENGPTPRLLIQAVVAAALPLVLAGPIAGYVADKYERRQILVTGQGVRSLLMLAAVFGAYMQSQFMLYVLFGLSMCITRILYTARAASVRHLVRQHELVAADSVMLMASMVAGSIGAVSGAFLYRYIGFTAFMVSALLHFVAAYVFDSVRSWLGGGNDSETVTWSVAFQQLRMAKTRFAITSTSAHRFLLGVSFAAIALLLDHRVDIGASGYAVTLGASGVGAFVGTMTAERINEKMPRRTVTLLAFAFSSLAALAAVAVTNFLICCVSVVVMAFSFQNLRVCSDATIQANAMKGSCGRIFAAYDMAYNLSFLVGLVSGLAASTMVNSHTVLSVTACTFAAGTTLFALMPRSEKSEAGNAEVVDVEAALTPRTLV
ncbi:MAG: MFS transporter [Actinomycetes bacterium]